jgi:AP-2 complex subunit sigma-1
VYRRYAGLFFCVCVDANDNELAYLEAIHLFVEILGECGIYFHDEEERMTEHGSSDAFFDNVCELDLVFNFYKASTAYTRTRPRLTQPRRCMLYWTRYFWPER